MSVREQMVRIIAANRCNVCDKCSAVILNRNPIEVVDEIFAILVVKYDISVSSLTAPSETDNGRR